MFVCWVVRELKGTRVVFETVHIEGDDIEGDDRYGLDDWRSERRINGWYRTSSNNMAHRDGRQLTILGVYDTHAEAYTRKSEYESMMKGE